MFQPLTKIRTRYAPPDARTAGSPIITPSDASCPPGTASVNWVRYHDVPATVASGTCRVAQPVSRKPGRCQPLRSPNSPPLLSGPRTGSAIDSPPALPWIFQLAASADPLALVIAPEISPRPSLLASLTP